MAHTVKVLSRTTGRRRTILHVGITLTGSYASPGEAITAAELGLNVITHAMVQPSAGQQTNGYMGLIEPKSGTTLVDSDSAVAGATSWNLRFLGGNSSLTTVTSSAADTFTLTGHNLADGDVVLMSTVTTTTGITAGTSYYVRDTTATTFKVAAAPGGAAIDLLTGAGTAILTKIGGPALSEMADGAYPTPLTTLPAYAIITGY